MAEHIGNFKAKKANIQGEKLKAREKSKALLQEAKGYYGYTIYRDDPRFKQMVKKKAEEAKKERMRQKKLMKAMSHSGKEADRSSIGKAKQEEEVEQGS